MRPHLLPLLALTLTACGSAVSVTDFPSCIAAGYPAMESMPRQCRTPDGQTFVEDIGNALDLSDRIRVTSIRPGADIGGNVHITGEARGNWFFEASFPIRLEDEEGTVLATAIATADGEWMTNDFVPFAATLKVPADASGNANLILQRDNPSGLPEHDAALRIPVQLGAGRP